MSIDSMSLYGSSYGNRASGLMSGLDTDDLVEKMLSATKSKINKQYQAQQKLVYQQEIYRSISDKMVGFKDKYFSFGSESNSNILSTSFFKSHNIKSSSDFINVSGDVSRMESFSITNVESVATRARLTSEKKVSGGTFESKEMFKFTSSLAGGSMTLNYGGTDYTVKFDRDFGSGEEEIGLGDIVNHLNAKLGDIEGLEDVEVELLEGNKIKIVGEEGSVRLTAASSDVVNILKLQLNEEAESSTKIEESDLYEQSSDIFSSTSEYFEFSYNGVIKQIKMKEGLSDASEVAVYVQEELDRVYGEGNAKIEFDAESNKFKFSASGANNTFEINGLSSGLSTVAGISSGLSNRLDTVKSLEDINLTGLEDRDSYKIKINGSEIEVGKDMSIYDIIKKINSDEKAGVTVYYSSTSDTFTIESDETGSHRKIDIEDVDGNLASTLFGNRDEHYVVKDGLDTVMNYSMNGVDNKIVRSTSSFSVDGINVELSSRASTIDFTEPVTFEVENNNQEIVDKLKDFVKDYNELLELVNNTTSEKPNRKYSPLTPDQRKDMKEKEIENWDAEAKKGLLFGDTLLTGIARNLRAALGGISENGMSLASIGIESAPRDTSGKLVINEEKLNEALSSNSGNIQELFTSKNGLASKIANILKDNVGMYGTSGNLIDRAGRKNSMSSDNNTLSKSIKGYDELLERLKKTMETERERHYSKFSALESAMARLNAQAAMFVQAQE